MGRAFLCVSVHSDTTVFVNHNEVALFAPAPPVANSCDHMYTQAWSVGRPHMEGQVMLHCTEHPSAHVRVLCVCVCMCGCVGVYACMHARTCGVHICEYMMHALIGCCCVDVCIG